MQDLDEAGIETRQVFWPMHVLPPIAIWQKPFPALNFAVRPNQSAYHGQLTENDMDRVADALERRPSR